MIDLETPRLNFRLWQAKDFEAIANYFSDAEKTKYVGGQKSREAAWRLMATYIGHYHLRGYGYLAIEEKSTNKLIGTVGLWKSEPWPELELGYWLLSEMQGKGFATEAGESVRNFAFEKLGVNSFVSYIASENEPSKRLALRLGAKYESDIELLEFGKHCVYRYHKSPMP